MSDTLPQLPPSLMDYFTARAYSLVGWSIRRQPWRIYAGITVTPATTDKPLAWIRLVRAAWNISGIAVDTTPYDPIVLNTDVVLADKIALDWTCDPPEGVSTTPGDPTSNPSTDPNSGLRNNPPGAPSAPPSPGSGPGASPPGSGPPGYPITPPPDNPGDPDNPAPLPARTAPLLSIEVVGPDSDACIPETHTPTIPDILNSFSANITLAADPRHLPGEIWALHVSYGTPAGFVPMFPSTTMVPGQTVGVGPFSINAQPGSHFKMIAAAHLASPNLTANASGDMNFQPLCPTDCPEGQAWNFSSGMCEVVLDCPLGQHRDTDPDSGTFGECVPD